MQREKEAEDSSAWPIDALPDATMNIDTATVFFNDGLAHP